MSTTAPIRRPPTFVWAIWGLIIVASLTALVMMVVNREIPVEAWGARWTMETWGMGFGTVGAIVSWRVRGNAIGPLLLAAGVGAAVLGLVIEVGLATSGSGLGVSVLWFFGWWWIPIVACMAVALVLFPTGRPSSPFWRAWVVVIAVMTVLHVLAVAFVTQGIEVFGAVPVPNPFAPSALARIEWIVVPTVVGFQLSTVIGFGSLFWRRSGGPVARQQLRWLRFTIAAAMALVLFVEVGVQLEAISVPAYKVGTYLVGLSIVLIPIAIGIAVLRYRLYEIDRIVSRTVGYAIVTAILGLVYVATVLSFQGLFTSQAGEVPDLLVAGTTLALAAAFIPLHRRIQLAVDRRFNRRTYDASRLLESLVQRLKDETDLQELSRQVRTAAAEIVQPTRVGLWLPPGR